MDQPAESQLQGTRLLNLEHRLVGRDVVDVRHEEAGLDPGHVQSVDSGRSYGVGLAYVHEDVPDPLSMGRVEPDLVPQVPGEAGATDRDRGTVDRGLGQSEEAQIGDVLGDDGVYHVA